MLPEAVSGQLRVMLSFYAPPDKENNMGAAGGPDFAGRRKRLKKLMLDKGLDALVTSDVGSVFYYTGYDALRDDRVFMIFPSGGRPKLLVSPLENDARTKYPRVGYISSVKDFIAELRGFEKLGYDERSLNLLVFQEMNKSLKAKLERSAKMIEQPRIRKDEHEIGRIRKAIAITGKALAKVSGSLAGKTEKEIADSLEIEFRRAGTTESFESIVCAGKNSVFVHHKPGPDAARAGDIVLIDTGCRCGGYCTDITRMFFRRLSSRQKRIYGDVKHVQAEIIGHIRAGMSYKELESLQKKLFTKYGYTVVHGVGHGVGLAVHEDAGEGKQSIIPENAVLAIEPGVYVPGSGGFRVEDMVLVKRNGAEVLSKGIPVL